MFKKLSFQQGLTSAPLVHVTQYGDLWQITSRSVGYCDKMRDKSR
jgi:hypothetical protein